jgi:phosphohistidine phosphatase
MKLIMVRHAEAIERVPEISDGNRYLTPEGRSMFRKTAGTMKEKGINPGVIITSPLLRAVQTADILAETILYTGPLVASDDLSPGFQFPALQVLLAAYQDVGEMVIVGHEPDLSAIISALLALPERFSFKKAAAVKLTINSASIHEPATFKWYALGKKLMKSRQEFLEATGLG